MARKKIHETPVQMRPEDFELLSYGPRTEPVNKLPDPLEKLRELRERHQLTRDNKKVR